jgi:nucleotide-binding universal stress UspA family protein
MSGSVVNGPAARTPNEAPPGAPVVVGVDGSAAGLTAARSAAREAALHGRPLRVIHSFNWAADPDQPPEPAPRARGEQVLAEAVEQALAGIPNAHKPSVDCALIEGPAVTALLRESGTAALLVIGDAGLMQNGCVAVDTTTVRVAARAGCTVLVTRVEPPAAGPVLVGVDGNVSTNTALEFAFDAATRRTCELIAVRVWDPAEAGDRTATELADRLAESLEPWCRRYPGVTVHQLVPVGEAPKVLVAASAEAELAVVATRGSQAWRGLLGTVTQALLYHSPAPVAIVRASHDLYVQE